MWYPKRRIVIIDDNSDANFVKAFREYTNLEVIASEFPGRGELLPYYYFYHRRFFDVAVIIHDSVFFHKRIAFEKFRHIDAAPLWNFPADTENVGNTLRLISGLKNRKRLVPFLTKAHTTANSFLSPSVSAFEFPILGMPKTTHREPFGEWTGCFGVQTLIRHTFLSALVEKYDLFQLLQTVKCRADRCCLERIFGVLLFLEVKYKTFCIFGNIFQYQKFHYSYEEYKHDFYVNKKIPRAVTKVWTGR
jgi:hypothetical protein